VSLQCFLSGHEFLYFYFSWKVFIPLLIVKDNFAGYSNVGWQLFSLRIWNTFSNVLLVFINSVDKSAAILMGLPLYDLVLLSYSC
jgi:hypothetical protein